MEIKKEWLLDSFDFIHRIFDPEYVKNKISELDNDDIIRLILRYHYEIECSYGLYNLNLNRRIWTDEHIEILSTYGIHCSCGFVIDFKHTLDVTSDIKCDNDQLICTSSYSEYSYRLDFEIYQFFRERPYYLYKITGKLPYFLREILFDHEKPGRGPISPEIGIKFVHSDLIFRYI